MKNTRRALLASLMVAVAVSVGYALAGVPNVELMTITVFIAGYLLGPGLGALVGAVAMLIHSTFNPLGAALPPLLLGQVIGFSVIGVTGGIVGPFIARVEMRWLAFLISGATGLGLTLLYHILTNVGAFYSITAESAPDNLFRFVAAGIGFTLMHLVWNTALFLVVNKPVLNVLERYRAEIR